LRVICPEKGTFKAFLQNFKFMIERVLCVTNDDYYLNNMKTDEFQLMKDIIGGDKIKQYIQTNIQNINSLKDAKNHVSLINGLIFCFDIRFLHQDYLGKNNDKNQQMKNIIESTKSFLLNELIKNKHLSDAFFIDENPYSDDLDFPMLQLIQQHIMQQPYSDNLASHAKNWLCRYDSDETGYKEFVEKLLIQKNMKTPLKNNKHYRI